MLGLPDDDLADADRAGLANRFAQKRIWLVAALARDEIVRSFEVARVDLFFLDEIENVDRLGLLECGGLEVFVGEHDELSLLVLVAFDHLVPWNGLTFRLANALVLHRREIFLMEQPEADMVGAH